MRRRGAVVSIDKVRKGHVASVRDAVLDHLDELYRFALRLTRQAERARELVHESILRALEREQTLVVEPCAWLFQTLYHTFVSQYRADLRHEVLDKSVSSAETEFGDIMDPLPAAIAMEDVRRAVENLREEFRAVVWLSDAEQFSLREIAEILECPLGTVASRLARGRQELRRFLSAYGPPREKRT